MKHFFTVLLLFSLSAVFSQYHYPKQEHAKLVLNSTLIVELLEGESDEIHEKNKRLKKVFSENWSTSEVLFRTLSQIDSLIAVTKNGYAILYQQKDTPIDRSYRGETPSLNTLLPGINSSPSLRNSYSFRYYQLLLNILLDGEKKYVTSICFKDDRLAEEDYLFAYQQLNLLLHAAAEGKKSYEYYNAKQNIERLKSSTFIIPKFMFKEKHLSKINKFYKYDHRLVDSEEYQKIILDKKQNVCYFKLVWSSQHQFYMSIAVNVADGAVLSISSHGGVYLNLDQEAPEKISARHLKLFTSKFAQKINNRYGWKL